MRPNHAKTLLEDKELRDILKSSIIEKMNRYEHLQTQRENFLLQNKHALSDDFGKYFLEQVFDRMLHGQEVKQIEKDLANMCYDLRCSQGKTHSKEWAESYDKAVNLTQIEDVANRYLQVENFNRNIICPFHEEKTPSLKIYPKKNFFICFGCGARGSPITFVMKYENCSFKEAVLKLSNL